MGHNYSGKCSGDTTFYQDLLLKTSISQAFVGIITTLVRWTMVSVYRLHSTSLVEDLGGIP